MTTSYDPKSRTWHVYVDGKLRLTVHDVSYNDVMALACNDSLLQAIMERV